jgi:hypothetical protein
MTSKTSKWMAPAVAALVGIGLVACSDSEAPTGLMPEALFSHADGQAGDHNGPVWVQVDFEIPAGDGVAKGINQHPQGQGTCRNAAGETGSGTEHTVWYNSQGKKTTSKFCEGTEGTEAGTCTAAGDGIPATYAAAGNAPGSGNENLNFFVDDPDLEVEDYFVHYKAQADFTDGMGEVTFDYTCGNGVVGTTTLDLAQFTTDNPDGGSLFTGALSTDIRGLTVTGVQLTAGQVVTALYWTYRSRVGDD